MTGPPVLPPERRVPSVGELRLDAAVHVAGLAFAALAGPTLIVVAIRGGGLPEIASASVYVATMAAMFTFSALYNLAPTSRAREWLRRLDHGAIYLKIAGTYTPFGIVSMGHGTGPRLVLGVWLVALAGFALKLAAPRRLEAASVLFYLALGWAIVLVADEAMDSLSVGAGALLVAGGLLYTAGVPFHLWNRLRYQNAIWHMFVLAATACMTGAVAVEVAGG